jgi:hypothetical protein
LPRKVAQAYPHIDPDFRAATHGDAAPRKCRKLNKLMPRDILVFYFRVKAVHRVSARSALPVGPCTRGAEADVTRGRGETPAAAGSTVCDCNSTKYA